MNLLILALFDDNLLDHLPSIDTITMDLKDEKQLLKDLRKGNALAYKQMYHSYYNMALSFITKNNGAPEDAEDVFHEALMVFINNIRKPDFTLTSKISTYLFGVIRRMWLHKLKSKGATVPIKEMEANIPDLTTDDIADKMVFELRHELIAAMLKKLSEECRKIIVDYYYKNVKLKDIGEAMNYTASFIKVKKNRCMNDFMRKVKAHPDYKNTQI